MIRIFFNQAYKYDTDIIKNTEMFTQLKPRLQRAVKDKLFDQFYV